jgi:hypothetical protein
MEELLPFTDAGSVLFLMRSQDGTVQAEIVRDAKGGFVVMCYYLSDDLGYPTAHLTGNSFAETYESAWRLGFESIGGEMQFTKYLTRQFDS